jgi:glycosyltransferase involved in cell wall biosynthesis
VSRPVVLRAVARLNVGGPTQHVVLLTRALRDRYPTLLVAGDVQEGEADMSSFASRHGVEVTRIPELGRSIRFLDDLVALYRLWRLCRLHRPSIVHTHTAKAGTLGRVAAILAGVRLRVHTYHGHVFHGYFSRARTLVFLGIERILARFTARIVAISPRQKEELAGHLRLAPERIAVIPLGLDLERFLAARPAAGASFRAAIGAGPGEVVVTLIGRLAPIKNHALALRALARLAPRHPSLVMAIVGGGECEAALREQARVLGVAERVRFAGWWSAEDLPAVYQGSDIVALTSDNEGTPVCLIEALVSGRAVVATDVGGVRDVLDGGRLGVMVPAGDDAALAGALERLVEGTGLARWSNLAREETAERYGVARLAADVGALYDELLGIGV